MLSSLENVPYSCTRKGLNLVDCNICHSEEAEVIIGKTVLCGKCAEVYGKLLAGENYICPVCRTDRDSIVFSRMAGCPECYRTFAREIALMSDLSGKINEPVRN